MKIFAYITLSIASVFSAGASEFYNISESVKFDYILSGMPSSFELGQTVNFNFNLSKDTSVPANGVDANYSQNKLGADIIYANNAAIDCAKAGFSVNSIYGSLDYIGSGNLLKLNLFSQESVSFDGKQFARAELTYAPTADFVEGLDALEQFETGYSLKEWNISFADSSGSETHGCTAQFASLSNFNYLTLSPSQLQEPGLYFQTDNVLKIMVSDSFTSSNSLTLDLKNWTESDFYENVTFDPISSKYILSTTSDGVQVIFTLPEPSEYAAIFGALVFALALLRRGKKHRA